MYLAEALSKLKKNKADTLTIPLFLIAILIFSFLFFIQRHFMNNFDENDHLAIGYLMKNGYLLYKDTFSHHFPLPYYWTYLFTPFWTTFPSRTIAVFRLSVMVIYLLVFSLVFVSYKNRLSKTALSLWLILISTFLSLYHGNLVLSETFTAIFLIGVLWLLLPHTLGWEKHTKLNNILLILFTSAIFWTQPLTIFLLVVPLFFTNGRRRNFLIALIIFINIIPILIFYITNQLQDFWEQGIWFNFSIYQSYFADNTPHGNTFLLTLNDFIKHQSALITKFTNGNEIFQFILNLSFLSIFAYFIKTKNIKATIATLFIFAASRVREVKITTGEPYNFGIFPYLLLSSACFVILLTIFRKKILIVTVFFILLTVISIYNSRKIFIQSLNPEYNYHVFWNDKSLIGQKIKSLTLKNETILIYPHDVDLYYFADRLPPDKFTYWFPWIDSVDKYRQERLTSLSNRPPALIYIGNLDFKGIKDYYWKYFPNLTNGYTKITKDDLKQGLWLRNDLLERIDNN